MKKVIMKKVKLVSLAMVFFAGFLSAKTITKDGIEYEQVCNVPTGCSYDAQTGECPLCEWERKWDIEIVRDVVPVKVDRRVDKSLIGNEIEGRYQVTHAENTEGFFAIWESGVYLDISKLGENLYMVNVNGIGKVNGQNVDCSDPPIFTMKLDSDGNQLNRIDIAKGSCPISKFVPVREEGIIGSPLSQYTRWDYTLEGLKKSKRWSATGEHCVVGPCKGIRYITHIFYYKRITNG